VVNGIPLMTLGEWVVAPDHVDPQEMAVAVEGLLLTHGEQVHIRAGVVRLCWGFWDDGQLVWDGVSEDHAGAGRFTVVSIGR
jgi:hypothetical protein